MLQTSPNKDAQSPAASGAESLTETPPSGLPTAGVGPGSGGVDSPGGPPMGGVGLGGPAGIPGMRPGMQGPMGPGHHMGPPPYSLPPGYRGMMPHYVSDFVVLCYVLGLPIFMPLPFEEWWRGIKCYPCPSDRYQNLVSAQ